MFQLSGHKTGCCVMVQAANLQGDQFSSVGWPSPIGLTDNYLDLYRLALAKLSSLFQGTVSSTMAIRPVGTMAMAGRAEVGRISGGLAGLSVALRPCRSQMSLLRHASPYSFSI